MITRYYETDLLPDYSRVVTNIGAYLENRPKLEIDTPPQVAGAYSLTQWVSGERGDPRAYNYAEVDGVFYFVRWGECTNNSFQATLSIDFWHNQNTLTVTGTMTAAHDMCDIIAGDKSPAQSYFKNVYYPVDPIAGALIRLGEWGWGESNPTDLCVVANMTIGDDNEERDVIVFSPPCEKNTELSVLRGYIGNYGRARKLNNNKVISVNNIWVVPYVLIGNSGTGGLAPTTNAELTLDNVEATIGCYWYTNSWNVTKWVLLSGVRRYINFGDRKVPIVPKFGNLGASVGIPLTALDADVYLNVAFNGSAGHFSIVLFNGDTRVNVMPSLSASFSAYREQEKELSRKVSTAIGVGTSALAIVGGIATANPVAIGGGIAGAVSTLASNAARVEATNSTVEGDVLNNIFVQTRYTNGAATIATGVGLIEYACANGDEVINALTNDGYIGAAHVEQFDLLTDHTTSTLDNTFTYTASRRKFSPENLYVACDKYGEDAKSVIRDALTRGVTVFYNGAIVTPSVNYTTFVS